MRTFVDAAALTERVRGPVLRPGDADFDTEIAAWNVAVIHRPAVAVGALDAADVAATVRWAAQHDLRVAVQATGHGQAAGVDGGVLITTRRMDGVSIDPIDRRAKASAGVTWRKVIDAAAEHGLAPLNGSSSGVGVIGYTLGGGLGPMARRYGFAADHVRSLEIVTADGLIRTVDGDHEAELFWALRGAGKVGFGIVTAVEFDLMPVTTLYGGGIFYPAAATADVLHAFQAWAPTLTEQTTTSVAMLRLPDLPHVPEPLRGHFVTHLRFAHLGGADEGERLLAPMRTVATALIDTVAEMPYTAVDSIHSDPTDPMPSYDAGIVLKDLPAEAVDALMAAAGPQVELPLAVVELRLLGGAVGRPPATPNAVSGRTGAYSLLALGPLAPGLDQIVPAVVAGVLDAMEPFSAATSLVNFQGGAAPAGVAYGAWAPAERARLALIKKSYDPADMFGPAPTTK